MLGSVSPFFPDPAVPIFTTLLYLAAGVVLFLAAHRESQGLRKIAVALAILAVLLHTVAQYRSWLVANIAQADFATAMSLCALLFAILWLLSLFGRKSALESGIVALPLAALGSSLVWLLPEDQLGSGLHAIEGSSGVVFHVITSVTAFGLLALAGVYAFMVAFIDHSLKGHRLGRLVQVLPPLEQLEVLLFQLIFLGFILLTAALGSGLLFVEDLMAQHLVHKTVLAIAAWVIFGVLLLGKKVKGWRGLIAVRLTLAGFAVLLLSYFGSKLVLEVILGRSWYS